MSILIKGMEMPQSCDDCVMGHELSVGTCVTGYGCLAMLRMGEARIRPISCGTKPDWCPLIEVPTSHGRLIDADALLESIKEARKKDPEIEDVYIDDYFTVAEWVVSAPTIIPADKDGE